MDNLSNEQLTTLLQQILGKLRQEGDPEAETQVPPAAAETPFPDADPKTIEEIIKITIYDNKKLVIEALPGYMFIQPTKPVKSEPEPDKESEHYNGEICGTDEWGYPCHWYLKLDGSYNCECGNG